MLLDLCYPAGISIFAGVFARNNLSIWILSTFLLVRPARLVTSRVTCRALLPALYLGRYFLFPCGTRLTLGF